MFLRLVAFFPLGEIALLVQELSGHLALPLLPPFHLNRRDHLVEISLLEIALIDFA
jgi:hypothetical protein